MRNELFKKLRKEKKIPQDTLADMVGASKRSIESYEEGRHLPNVIVAIRIAKILGVTVEELFSNQDWGC